MPNTHSGWSDVAIQDTEWTALMLQQLVESEGREDTHDKTLTYKTKIIDDSRKSLQEEGDT